MTDTDALVRRLRSITREVGIAGKAADALEEKDAEIERLKEKVKELEWFKEKYEAYPDWRYVNE